MTHDMQPHESKVVVPPKTIVRMDQLSQDNNLSCLNFDECNSTDYFDPITRQIYLQITPAEHSAQLKEIRIHMFNLYQNQWITKEIIQAKQLDLCRLAFQLCVVENERYIPVSPISFTSIIREQKMITRPRVSQSVRNQQYSTVTCSIESPDDYLSQDNKGDDNDNDFDFS
ncbi:unnamed protein product [Rotaria sp. Silwood1]|nr:unnamed protein product [Rotaria sp. Silwood1]